jgi:O-antigen/teichoic acid export membrane protein
MNKLETEKSKYLSMLVKTSFFIFFAVFISKLTTYIYKIIIARNFGPEVYGLFSLGLIIVSFVATFASLGLNDGLIDIFHITWVRTKNQR